MGNPQGNLSVGQSMARWTVELWPGHKQWYQWETNHIKR